MNPLASPAAAGRAGAVPTIRRRKLRVETAFHVDAEFFHVVMTHSLRRERAGTTTKVRKSGPADSLRRGWVPTGMLSTWGFDARALSLGNYSEHLLREMRTLPAEAPERRWPKSISGAARQSVLL
jgi:hypothetical protein